MFGRASWKSLAYASVLACAFGLSSARAQDCAAPSPPVAVSSGSVSLTTQTAWQAEGGEVEFAIKSAKIAADNRIGVCFRWKMQRGDPGPWRKAEAIRIVDRQTDTLKIAATVPSGMLPNAPPLPRHVKPNGPLGVYAVNESVPVADVRVILFDATGGIVVDGTSTIGVISNAIQCNVPGPQTTADLGKALLSDHKNWQPRGGEVEFTIKSTKANISPNAPVRVCFRWKVGNTADPGPFFPSGPVRILERQPDSVRLAVTIPEMPAALPHPPFSSLWQKQEGNEPVGSYTGFWMVPEADVRLLVFAADGSVTVDVWSIIGITFLPLAIGTALIALILAFIILWRICCLRLPRLATCNPILCVITSRYGYASLSQFQVMLWTFLVGASAVYVMALSGDLIEITTGTLVLLGISGTTTVVAKMKSGGDDLSAAPANLPGSASANAAAAAARKAADAATKALSNTNTPRKGKRVRLKAEADASAAEADARKKAADAIAEFEAATNDAKAAKAAIATAADKTAAQAAADKAADTAKAKEDAAIKAVAAADALSMRKPLWSDLVMDDSGDREIDVARVQMLYFTLITAGFVLMQVLRSYTIPVIPDGFLILMGISNGVYMGAKYVKPKGQ